MRRRRRLLGSMAVAWCVLGAAVAEARPGDRDPTFGDGGTRIVDFASDQTATDAAMQRDGRLVVVGSAILPGRENSYERDGVLLRLLSDGRLDPSFGDGGIVLTDFDGRGLASVLALQADGRIVVAGSAVDASDFAVARYNADGSLDTSFGTGGRQVTDFGGVEGVADVVVQPDGRIVVAGTSGHGPSFSDNQVAVARYTPDGNLDSGFGTGGRATVGLGPATATVAAVAVQPDGRIVIAGGAQDPSRSDNPNPSRPEVLVARLAPDGSADATFGVAGRARSRFGATGGSAHELAIQPDGRLLVSTNVDGIAGVARYRSDGSADATFGVGGVRVTGVTTIDPTAIALQPDGRILTEGLSGTRPPVFPTLARLGPAGSLDTSFGRGGLATAGIASVTDGSSIRFIPQLRRLIVQGDGRVLGVGSRGGEIAVVRFLGGNRCASRSTAKLTVSRAAVGRTRVLDVLAPIAAGASGRARVSYRSAGATTRFSAAVRGGRVRFRHRLSAARARAGTGILTVSYPGDGDTRPRLLRLRAAPRQAGLTLARPRLTDRRIRATGRISGRARGSVRLELEYGDAACVTRVLRVSARIRNGRWSLDRALSADRLAQLAAREGPVQAYATYTGSRARGVRGEVRTRQALPDR